MAIRERRMNNMNNLDRAELWIENEIKSYKDTHRRLSKRLGALTHSINDERLSYCVKNGSRYFSEVWVEDGVRKSRYLGPEDDREVLEIQEKRFIRKALPVLERKIRMLEAGVNEIGAIDFLKLNESMPKVYRLPDAQVKKIIGPDAEEKWYAKAVKEKAADDERFGISRPQDLIHTAKDGTKTRSKSEMAIANELINRGIPYLYEKPTSVRNYLLHPDFTFYSYSRMKPMIWEHAGMMGDEGYRRSFEERMDLYMRGGLVPCVDVIITFDTTDGRLDARVIDAIIDEYR